MNGGLRTGMTVPPIGDAPTVYFEPPATPGGRERRFQCPAPGFDGQLRTCKRRGCPRCGAPWARDWRRAMAINLAAKHGPVVLVTVTAPGADVLPWDEAHCAKRRPHKHAGPKGCRVEQRAAREWSESLAWRWQKLRNAANQATRRALRDELGFIGHTATVLLRVWEPQKRGVPHAHLVLAYATDVERRAARAYVEQLKRLAPEYGFGYADGHLEPITAEDAARYLSSYLTGRNSSSKRKSTIRENIAHPVMPRSLVWVTPALTSLSTSERIAAMRERAGVRRPTGVTMRWLRKARHLWASIERGVTVPRFRDTVEAVRAVSVYMQAFRKRPPPDLSPALRLARRVDLTAQVDGRAYVLERQWREQLRFAFLAVNQCYAAA